MKTDMIDNIEAIDQSTVTLEQLRWQYGTGISISQGSGRGKTHSYRCGVMTELGDIKEEVWYQVVCNIVIRNLEEEVLDALFTWHKEHNYLGQSNAQLHCEALQSYARRIWELPQWVDYIPFNRRFFPQVLKGAHIVKVLTSCCGKPGEVTQEQIDRARGGKISCPYCGIWSSFVICGAEDVPPWEENISAPPTSIL